MCCALRSHRRIRELELHTIYGNAKNVHYRYESRRGDAMHICLAKHFFNDLLFILE